MTFSNSRKKIDRFPLISIKLSGFTILRNIIKYDYPVKESIHSILPLVDELIIALGKSDDGTEEMLSDFDTPFKNKIKIHPYEWDDTLVKGGEVLSQATNFALSKISGNWGFYLQADEVIHEREYPTIKQDIEIASRKGYQAVSFSYLHFKGDYQSINPWAYPREIRVIKNHEQIRSVGDACTFHVVDRPRHPLTYKSNCHIYHYGWVKHPTTMIKKSQYFESLYHGKAWADEKYNDMMENEIFDEVKICRIFNNSHPKVMNERVKNFPPIPRKKSRWLYSELYKKFLKYGWV